MEIKVLYLTSDDVNSNLGKSQIIYPLYQLGHIAQFHIIYLKSLLILSYKVSSPERKTCRNLDFHEISPPSFLFPKSIIVRYLWMFLSSLTFILRKRPDIIHARSFPSALIACILGGITGTPYIYDNRGFWIQQRCLSRQFRPRQNYLYIFLYHLDLIAIRRAYRVVSLTPRASQLVRVASGADAEAGLPRFVTIPTFVEPADLGRQVTRKLVNPEIRLGYVGSIGTVYDFAAVCRLVSILNDFIKVRLLVYNDLQQAEISKVASTILPTEQWELKTIEYERRLECYQHFDALISLFVGGAWVRGSCPTRLVEALSLGCPIVTNVGFMPELIGLHTKGTIYYLPQNYTTTHLTQICRLLKDIKSKDDRKSLTFDSIARLENLYKRIFLDFMGLSQTIR